MTAIRPNLFSIPNTTHHRPEHVVITAHYIIMKNHTAQLIEDNSSLHTVTAKTGEHLLKL